MARNPRGTWIKLYHQLFDKPKFFTYTAVLSEGKRTKAQKRAAEDKALANVVRLYLALGVTDDGKIEYRDIGQRMILQKWMDMEGDELLLTLDQMANCSVIHKEMWARSNVVTTTNAVEQSGLRTGYADKSRNANNKKAEKT